MPIPLVTERLELRAPTLADAEPLAAVLSDAQAMRHIGAGEIWDRERIRELQGRKIEHLADKGYSLYTVLRRFDGAVLGDCGLWTWADTGEPEIGWRFAPAHWGQGYASEAARAVFAHGRDEIGLRHLICMAYDENVASWRIAERLGFALDRREERYGRLARRYLWTATGS